MMQYLFVYLIRHHLNVLQHFIDIIKQSKCARQEAVQQRCPSRLNICLCRDGDFENLWIFKSVTDLN
jgi:hypothetical protein